MRSTTMRVTRASDGGAQASDATVAAPTRADVRKSLFISSSLGSLCLPDLFLSSVNLDRFSACQAAWLGTIHKAPPQSFFSVLERSNWRCTSPDSPGRRYRAHWTPLSGTG